MTEERRACPRIPTYHPISFQTSGTWQRVETLLKDLAVNGLRCVSPSAIPVWTEVEIELRLAAGHPPVRVRGQTVWVRAIPHSDQFDLGIEFLNPPDQDRQRLSAYLCTLQRGSR